MSSGQGNDIAAVTGGHGQLRASHADRDQAVDLLKAAFVQGRLTTDELDGRVGEALVARTCAQLAALTADVRAAPSGSAPPPEPARARTRRAGSVGSVGKSAAGAVIAACVASVAVLAAAAGAHMRPGPDAVACQSFYVWTQGTGGSSSLMLDFSVAAASQGSDRALTADLQALRQAVLQYEYPAGPLPSGALPSGAAPQAAQNRVDAAIDRVSAACAPYGN